MQELHDYVIITLGLLFYAVGFPCFQLPYEITTGGLAGAGAVIFYATGFPVQYTFFIVNILLLKCKHTHSDRANLIVATRKKIAL